MVAFNSDAHQRSWTKQYLHFKNLSSIWFSTQHRTQFTLYNTVWIKANVHLKVPSFKGKLKSGSFLVQDAALHSALLLGRANSRAHTFLPNMWYLGSTVFRKRLDIFKASHCLKTFFIILLIEFLLLLSDV